MNVSEPCGYGIDDCNNPDTPRGRAGSIKGLDILNAFGVELAPDTIEKIADPEE